MRSTAWRGLTRLVGVTAGSITRASMESSRPASSSVMTSVRTVAVALARSRAVAGSPSEARTSRSSVRATGDALTFDCTCRAVKRPSSSSATSSAVDRESAIVA